MQLEDYKQKFRMSKGEADTLSLVFQEKKSELHEAMQRNSDLMLEIKNLHFEHEKNYNQRMDEQITRYDLLLEEAVEKLESGKLLKQFFLKFQHKKYPSTIKTNMTANSKGSKNYYIERMFKLKTLNEKKKSLSKNYQNDKLMLMKI